jgi:hypothetical protein
MADKQEAFNSTLTNAMPALPNDGTVAPVSNGKCCEPCDTTRPRIVVVQ